MDKKPSISEMANELKKAARLFKVLEHADVIASELAVFSKQKAKLEKEVDSLEAKKEAMQAEVTEAVGMLKDAEAATKAAKKELADVNKSTKQEVALVMAKARADATYIVDEAKSQAEAIATDIEVLKADKQAHIADMGDIKRDLATLKQSVEDHKAQLRKLIGV